MSHTLLFDLDGTITDPKEGITNAILFALKKIGIDGYTQESLTWCIGPPLLESFITITGGDTVMATDALAYYREYYKPIGMYECSITAGIDILLASLKEEGRTLYVATSKPTVFSTEILRHFSLSVYFDGIYGSELSGLRTKKEELIAHIIAEEKLSTDCVMIGDREYDILGAKKNGLPSIGVTWGYGSLAELQQAGADFICADLVELRTVIDSNWP